VAIDFFPSSPTLQRVKSRISVESWQRRVEKAYADEKVARKVLSAVKRGESLNAAVKRYLPANRRSWAMRRIPAYRERGIEALFDTRTPRDPKVTTACRQSVQSARTANPNLTVAEALDILRIQDVSPLPSATTIKREFAVADRHRRREEERRKRSTTETVDLPLAGGELLLAAELESGVIGALTDCVMDIAKKAKEESGKRIPQRDIKHRNRRGHFTKTYNHHRRRKRGEQTARYLLPAADKGHGRVPCWPRFVHERPKTIEAKLRMLTFSWMICKTKGWAALRSADAANLESLTGFAYMPSTLAKMVSALAISGADESMLQTVGQQWHKVAERHFGEPGAMAALYIDNHAKEVWSSLHTMSGKVSHRNRVMPCITATYAHTGAGTPLVLSVQSGAAPLCTRLVDLVAQAEKTLGGDVERAVVIDAEGSTFDLLESFKNRRRVLVTPLRPSRAPGLELKFTRGSYFRPYRDKDELRVGRCTLSKRSTGQRLELWALVVRRRHRRQNTVLLTNGLDPDLGVELTGRELADMYYRRWPVQENAFKQGAVLGLDKHRGNCSRMVANVAVVTKLEKLEGAQRRIRENLDNLDAEREDLDAAVKEATKLNTRTQAALATRRRRLDALINSGKTQGKTFARTAVDHQQALEKAERQAAVMDKASQRHEANLAKTDKLKQQLEQNTAKQAQLEPQRRIRQLDVAADKILTATKLVAALLISFASREYLTTNPMAPETFISRVLTLRGRKEVGPLDERIVFYENPRDPEVTAAVSAACEVLNRRALQRDGRRLYYAVEEAPTG
jgi:hypothetical protein